MCVICVKKRGIDLPTENQIRTMFRRNPHGSGYMFLNKKNEVEVHKGFMNVEELLRSLKEDKITKDDVIIYHFRIGTQGGNIPELTHPYPYTNDYKNCFLLDFTTCLGIAHNGIIPLTSSRLVKTETNDTIDFITKYLVKIVRNKDDLKDENVLEMIKKLTNSKWAFLNEDGEIALVGDFIEEKNGLLFSNSSYKDWLV